MLFSQLKLQQEKQPKALVKLQKYFQSSFHMQLEIKHQNIH